ncbi:MAG TPA: gamma-glutamyl-gamma-aminobutyrate hydrolase family protein [Conexibacter sp.]|nr:gamma-glutamyl-gamma-aminobutyrate hydrolase family protein [Conexibacter sp.]
MSRNRPLIAVTSSEMRDPPPHLRKPQSDPARREMALGMPYLEALERSGALPVVMPPLREDALDELLDAVDGLLLSGGPDVDPVAYGQSPHRCLGPTEPPLDAFELALAQAADRRGTPLLAICRGMQLLNVARGGTLIQHLPDVVGRDVEHRQREPGDALTHAVEVDPASRLAEVLGWTAEDVNSFHHQAIDALGRGLRVSARAPDGTIEAVEDLDRPFLLAVQWHAEYLVRWAQHAPLFDAFVAACREPAGAPA